MVTVGRVTAYRLISIDHKGDAKSNKIVLMLDGDLFVVGVMRSEMVRQFDIAPKVRVGG